MRDDDLKMAGIRVRVVAVVHSCPLDAGHDDADRTSGKCSSAWRAARACSRVVCSRARTARRRHPRHELQRVAHGQQRRRVEHDDVVRITDLLEERREAFDRAARAAAESMTPR